MKTRILFSYILLTILINNCNICLACEREQHHKNASVTLLAAVGSHESINLLLRKAKLIAPYSYFIGVGYRSSEILSTSIKFNVELMKHFGRQSPYEIALYPSIESPALYLGNVGFSWGIGDGISSLVGPYPKFEEYRNIKTKRLLNLLVIEQNIFLKDKPEQILTIRWHHRCHCFKTIAPKGSGSNFVGIGYRYSL